MPELDPLTILILAAVLLLALPAAVFALRAGAAIAAFARAHWFKSRLGSPLEEAVLRRRAGLLDSDVNLHITNARYLSLADGGRFDLLARLGFFPLLVRHGCRTLIGTTCVRFRRAVPLFARYTLRSRLLGWDEKWFYAEHRFDLDGRTAVLVLAKFVVAASRGRKLEPREALERMMGEEHLVEPPALSPAVVQLLRDSDALMSPD